MYKQQNISNPIILRTLIGVYDQGALKERNLEVFSFSKKIKVNKVDVTDKNILFRMTHDNLKKILDSLIKLAGKQSTGLDNLIHDRLPLDRINKLEAKGILEINSLIVDAFFKGIGVKVEIESKVSLLKQEDLILFRILEEI